MLVIKQLLTLVQFKLKNRALLNFLLRTLNYATSVTKTSSNPVGIMFLENVYLPAKQ